MNCWAGYESGPSTSTFTPRLNPVANLSETGNTILRLGATEPTRFTMAGDFLAELEAAELHKQSLAAVPPLAGKEPPALSQTPLTPPPAP